jgi:hypothetical protein
MTKLSPAAQAVKDAVMALYPDKATQDIGWPLDIPAITAALRAAADQVVPPALEEEFHDRNQALPLTKMVEIRQKLLTIAAELEGGND